MTEVPSRDRTTIAFDRIGGGNPIVQVDGALCDRSPGPNGALTKVVREHFTVFTYDGRGRGEVEFCRDESHARVRSVA